MSDLGGVRLQFDTRDIDRQREKPAISPRRLRYAARPTAVALPLRGEKEMGTKANVALASALLLVACAASLAQIADIRMVVVRGKDVSGKVFKRLGLPNQDYCWEQCLKEDRCTGTRWGAIGGTTAGQCQLLTGELTFGELHEIKTDDGTRITVTAARKEAGPARQAPGKSGT